MRTFHMPLSTTQSVFAWVSLLAVLASAEAASASVSVTLGWDPPHTGLVGYHVYTRDAHGSYGLPLFVAVPETSVTIHGLEEGISPLSYAYL